MNLRSVSLLGILLALLLPGSAHASSIYCSLQLLSPDCTAVAYDYRWAPDAQPTIGLGCVGYPTPAPRTDAGGSLPGLIDYFLPTMADVKLVIEAGGQTLTGGSFSDTGITCRESCNLDGGVSLNCPVSGLVRYTGPLQPGQEYKVTWTNSWSFAAAPYTWLKVAGAPSVDAGIATAANTSTTTSGPSTATSITTNTGTLATMTSTSTSAGISHDADALATATGTSSSSTVATDPGTATATTDTSTSAAIDTNPNGDAGAVRGKPSSSCSCTLGARERFPMLFLLSPLGLALHFGRRPRLPPKSPHR